MCDGHGRGQELAKRQRHRGGCGEGPSHRLGQGHEHRDGHGQGDGHGHEHGHGQEHGHGHGQGQKHEQANGQRHWHGHVHGHGWWAVVEAAKGRQGDAGRRGGYWRPQEGRPRGRRQGLQAPWRRSEAGLVELLRPGVIWRPRPRSARGGHAATFRRCLLSRRAGRRSSQPRVRHDGHGRGGVLRHAMCRHEQVHGHGHGYEHGHGHGHGRRAAAKEVKGRQGCCARRGW
mmetsp:Transcript_117766/g.333216  ORF Transcript_117766/g.333216 Transcript_117766/m.333216 type:complete len:230 (+) Transcript_117766:516-1205(+)